MIKVNDKYYICEEGHVTAGDTIIKKCPANTYNLHYIKGKRKGSWKGEKTDEKSCGKQIVEILDMPEALDYSSVWDYPKMHAFLIGQKFDAHFMIELQKAFVELGEKIDGSKK